MESAAELYTTASINKNELIEAKLGLLSDLFVTLICFYGAFYNNKNFFNACKSVIGYYEQFFSELEREHDLYDLIMAYLASFEYITDLDDEEILSDLSSIFDEIEICVEERLLFYANYCAHINNIFDTGILTNQNYLYPKYSEILSENKSMELRKLVPWRKS